MFASRRFLAFTVVASLATLVASVWVMALRVDGYLREKDHRHFIWQEVEVRDSFFGGRKVTISDRTTPGQGAGDQTVEIRYGDDALMLPATIVPGSPQLPEFKRHMDWLRVFRLAERGRVSISDLDTGIKTGQIRERLIAVVRIPPPGKERPLPGEVFRKDWSFDLYEFTPDVPGGFTHERLAFPKGRKAKPGELMEGSWQYYAAMNTMPKLGKPSPRFIDDALPAAGWTLPVAGFSGLVLTYALAMLFAPARRGRGEMANSKSQMANRT